MADEKLIRLIKGMSPGTLRIYKQQLPLRLKSMAPQDRESLLVRIKGIPGLEDIGLTSVAVAEPEPQKNPWDIAWSQLSLWKKMQEAAALPLNLLQEEAVMPMARVFGQIPTLLPGEQAGEAESYKAYQSGAWSPWHKAQQEAFEALPKWSRIPAEILPWLAIPGAGGIAGKLGQVGAGTSKFAEVARLGAAGLKPAAEAERVMAYPITKPLEILSPKLRQAALALTKRPLRAGGMGITPGGIPEPKIPRPVEGTPEAGVQAGFTPEGEIFRQPYIPVGKGKVTQSNLDDLLKLGEWKGEIKSLSVEATVEQTLTSDLMSPTEKVAALKGYAADLFQTAETNSLKAEGLRQQVSTERVIQDMRYKKVPIVKGPNKGDYIEMVKYRTPKWYKLDEAPLDEWGTELGMTNQYDATRGFTRDYREILKDKIRAIPQTKKGLAETKRAALETDALYHDSNGVNGIVDKLESPVEKAGKAAMPENTLVNLGTEVNPQMVKPERVYSYAGYKVAEVNGSLAEDEFRLLYTWDDVASDWAYTTMKPTTEAFSRQELNDALGLFQGMPKQAVPPEAAIPPVEAAPVTAKEPWQMKREEFNRKAVFTAKTHEERVQEALSQGKPVPQEVLKDYPELAKAVPPAPVEAKVAEMVKAPPVAPVTPVAPPIVSPLEVGQAKTAALKAAAETRAAAARPAPVKPVQVPPVKPPETPPVQPPKPPVTPTEATIKPTPEGPTLPDLQPIDEAITVGLAPDTLRKVANIRGFQGIAKVLGGLSATAKTNAEKAMVGVFRLKFEAQMKSISVMAPLERIGPSHGVFDLTEEGLVASGALKDTHLNTILTYPERYSANLTDKQREWVEAYSEISSAIGNYARENGIRINELTLEEGGQWAGRRAYGRFNADNELIEVGFIAPGPGRPGAKAVFEKERIFKSIEEAIKAGFRYIPDEEALFLNVRAVYNRVANNRMKDWILAPTRQAWRTTEIFSLPKANNLINQSLRRLPIKPQQLEALKRDMPEVAAMLEKALSQETWEAKYAALQELKQFIRTFVPTEEAKLFWAVEKLTAQRTTVQNAIEALQRVKRGERLPTGTIKAISKVLPDIKDKLTTASRLSLDDLIKAGAEAAEYPKTLEVGPAYAARKRALAQLADLQAKLAADPNNSALYRQVQKTKARLGFAKYRLAVGEPIEFAKSPVSILKGKHYEAIDEMLRLIRGEPLPAKTATGKAKTIYKGGLLKDFQAKENEAKALRQKVSEEARRVKLEEATVPTPAFAGVVFTGPEAKETARLLTKEFTPQQNEALQAINKFNSVTRWLILSADMSPATIQLLYMAGGYPKVYKTALAGMVKSWFDPTFLLNYLAKPENATIVAKSRGVILSVGRRATTEFTEIGTEAGLLRTKPFIWAGKLLEPAMRGFDAGITIAGIELRKSLDHLCTTPANTEQVEAFINEFRGLASTARLGVNREQRLWETIALLAPRYTRAIGSLLVDVFRGNLRGQLARKAMAQGVAAVTAMGVAISFALGDSPEEMVEHINPASPKFLTWQIAGQNVGPGSKVRSVIAAFAKSVTNPDDLYKISMQNPNLQFIRGNLSPVMSTGLDVITGKNYMGDPTRNNLLSLSKTVIAENVLPLWIQSVAFEGGDITTRAAGAAMQFVGMRQYPLTPTQERDNLRNQLAQEKYGMTWDELASSTGPGKLTQRQLENESPELAQATAEADQPPVRGGEATTWYAWRKEGESIEADYQKRITLAAREFKKIGDGITFREKVNEAATIRRAAYNQRNAKTDYADIQTALNEPLDKEGMNPLDVARVEYYRIMSSPDLYDEFGNYKFDLADTRRQQFVRQYGQDAMNYIEEWAGTKWQEPDELKVLRQAQQLLRPYWNIENQVWAKYPAGTKELANRIAVLEQTDPLGARRLLIQHPEILYGRKVIAIERKRMRLSNPAIRQALTMFY